jgi:beta-glucosidase
MMNLARNAAAGRNWEGGGADPFLSGVQSTGVISLSTYLPTILLFI